MVLKRDITYMMTAIIDQSKYFRQW